MKGRTLFLLVGLSLVLATVPAVQASTSEAGPGDPRVVVNDDAVGDCVDSIVNVDSVEVSEPGDGDDPSHLYQPASDECPGTGGGGAPVDVGIDIGDCDCTDTLVAVDNVQPGFIPLVQVDIPPVYVVDCEVPTLVNDGTVTQTVVSADDSCPIPFGTAIDSSEVHPIQEQGIDRADLEPVDDELLEVNFGACDVTVTAEHPAGSAEIPATAVCATVN